MALGGGGADQMFRSELRHYATNVLSTADDLVSDLCILPGENAVNSGGITDQNDRLSAYRSFRAIIEFEHSGPLRDRNFELESGNVSLCGDAIKLGAQSRRLFGEVDLV